MNTFLPKTNTEEEEEEEASSKLYKGAPENWHHTWVKHARETKS